MPDLEHWSIFLTAAIILLLIPGPSVMYVMARGIEHGHRGAILSSVGLALGDLLQVLAAVAGVSALLASSAMLFGIVKYVGAAYLILLGLRRLLTTHDPSVTGLVAAEHSDEPASRALVVQALFALNPKTAMFFLALFPQFVAVNAGPGWFQILLFGCTFVVVGFVTNSVYGCMGGTLRFMAKDYKQFKMISRYVSGAVLTGMGVAAALAAGPH